MKDYRRGATRRSRGATSAGFSGWTGLGLGLAIGLGRLITLLDISTSKREDAYSLAIPLAIVFNTVNPILAQGAAFGDMTMLAGFDVDITGWVPDGSLVEIDPVRKLLRVL